MDQEEEARVYHDCIDCSGTGMANCRYCENGNVYDPDTYMRPMRCPECDGRGASECWQCDGLGEWFE